MLIKYFLISLKINTSINFPLIHKDLHSFNYNNIRNESNILENNFINKKTKRNQEKNEINQEIEENKKEQIFIIKKINYKIKKLEKIKKKNDIRRSKFRGVSRNGNKWQALIMINRKKNFIGNFNSEEEAANAYDEYAMKYHKNKARLNFPHQGYLSV